MNIRQTVQALYCTAVFICSIRAAKIAKNAKLKSKNLGIFCFVGNCVRIYLQHGSIFCYKSKTLGAF